jgi:hypothetical protein
MGIEGTIVDINEIEKAVEFYRSAKAGRITEELTRLKKYRTNARKAFRDLHKRYTLERLLREKFLEGDSKRMVRALKIFDVIANIPLIATDSPRREGISYDSYIQVPAELFQKLKKLSSPDEVEEYCE